MKQQYLMPAARCPETGQLIKRQDLSGKRYMPNEQREVQILSEILAEDLSLRTQRHWTAEPIKYLIK